MLHKLIQTWRERGFLAVCSLLTKNVIYLIKYHLDGRVDRKYGTDTRGRVELRNLNIGSANKNKGVYYEPTTERTFRKLMSFLPIDFQDYSLVDFGCGKGRVLLYAGELGFKQVIGVEFAPELAAIARGNAARFGDRTGNRRIEVRCEDATETRLPDGPCVFFFYNPFEKEVMDKVARRIIASLAEKPRKAYIIYYNNRRPPETYFDVDYVRVIAHGTYYLDPAVARLYSYVVYESRDDRPEARPA